MNSRLIGGGIAIAASIALASSGPVASNELADRMAIERLVVEYAYLLDHGRADELAALFTPDGVLDTAAGGEPAVGRAAIAAYYAKRALEPRITRHITTNLRVVFDSANTASTTRIILYYRGDGARLPFPAKPASVSEYEERLQRGKDGIWRFVARKNRLLFVNEHPNEIEISPRSEVSRRH